MSEDIQRRAGTRGRSRVLVVLIGLLLFGAQAACAPEPPAAPKPTTASPTVDFDLVFKAVRPLAEDPAMCGFVVPEGEELLRMQLDEIPASRRAEVAPGLLDARMLAVFADGIASSLLVVRVLHFLDSDVAASFVGAWRAASEEEDAGRDGKPGSLRVLETTYEKGAGPDGRMSGYVVRKMSSRAGHAMETLSEVARLGSVVVVIEVTNLVDITRHDLDQALVRAEAALADPDAARRSPVASPVLLASLGPVMSIHAVGADGSVVPRFTFRVSWVESPGNHRVRVDVAQSGVCLARVSGRATVEIWAARSREGKPLRWGPGSVEVNANTRDVEVTLPQGMSLSGTVRDKQGKNVEGLRVVAFPSEGGMGIPAKELPPGGLPMSRDWAHSEDRTGPSGTFDLQGLGPSRYRISVDADGEWYTVNDVEAGAGSEPVSLVVEKALNVDVVVLGPDDVPLAGAMASAFPTPPGQFSAGFDTDLTFDTGESGVAHMRRLRAAWIYRLTILPPEGREDLATSVQEHWSPAATTVRLQTRGTGGR